MHDVILTKVERYDAVLDRVERVLGILPRDADICDGNCIVFIAVDDDVFDAYICGDEVNMDDIDGEIVE